MHVNALDAVMISSCILGQCDIFHVFRKFIDRVEHARAVAHPHDTRDDAQHGELRRAPVEQQIRHGFTAAMVYFMQSVLFEVV